MNYFECCIFVILSAWSLLGVIRAAMYPILYKKINFISFILRLLLNLDLFLGAITPEEYDFNEPSSNLKL